MSGEQYVYPLMMNKIVQLELSRFFSARFFVYFHIVFFILEYSNEVITRLQHESSRESNHITHLKEEMSNISKMMMELRACV